MDRKQQWAVAALFSFVAAYCGIGCLMTGMGFLNMPMFPILAACALAALVTALTANKKWFIAIPAAFVLLCLRLWRKGSLELSLETFLSHISHLYNSGYGWGIIRWTKEVLHRDMALLTICLLAAWLAMGLCFSFRRKGTLVTILLSALPVIPCMLLTDTVPEPMYLFATLLCIVLLLLIRLPKKQGRGMAVLKLAAIPAAVVLLILFLCLPQKNYKRLEKVDRLFTYVQELFADTGEETLVVPTAPVREEGSWVNLNAVGPKKQRRGIVMEVTANQTGYLYLRGAAYGTYHGTWWDYAKTEAPVYTAPIGTQRSAEITTKAIHGTLYLPYGTYSIGNSNFSILEEKGQVANVGQWRSYTVKYRDLPTPNMSWQIPSVADPAHTQLPASTRQAAQRYLSEHLPGLQDLGVWDKANAIVEHVSETALYSLNTTKMPAGTKDFALWFLEESDTGYCVHFATAASVLLRAADIPCRYVTGYLVYAKAGMPREVEQRNAHAWVEVYIDNVGWVPLEPTPGGGIAQTVDMETTAPTETEGTTETPETTEGATEGATEGTAETTQPPTTETTVPSKPTVPTDHADTPTLPGTPEEPEKPGHPWLVWVICSLLAVGGILGQWRVRVAMRERKRHKGKKSAQALARWQEVVLHCRVRNIQPKTELLAIAQKAKFSHHAISREELAELDSWLYGSVSSIRHARFWERLLATLIYALY